MRNAADAEDAVQECYLRALRHFDSYRGPAMKPWLLAILRNVCNAEFARRSKQPVAGRLAPRTTRRPTRLPMWQEPQASPEAVLLRQQDDATIRRLVAALPQPFREAIVLREVNDLSYGEIADVAGVPVGTVMSRLARARTMLRAAWNAEEGTPMTATNPKSCCTRSSTASSMPAMPATSRPIWRPAPPAPRSSSLPRHARSDGRGASERSRAGASAQPHRSRDACTGDARGRCGQILAQSLASASWRTFFGGFTIGTALSAAVAASLVIAVFRDDQNQQIASDVVSAHLRSLQAGHLTDVETSDQHTVKPWFNGKLDVAPPVIDLTAQGFTLIGGRLDYINGETGGLDRLSPQQARDQSVRRAAFGRRPSAAVAKRNRHGFNIRHWTEGGLDLWAVSDINAGELDEFCQKFTAALHPPPPPS
jgi:RNA polymerase sigma factor (sigma-70 family)